MDNSRRDLVSEFVFPAIGIFATAAVLVLVLVVIHAFKPLTIGSFLYFLGSIIGGAGVSLVGYFVEKKLRGGDGV